MITLFGENQLAITGTGQSVAVFSMLDQYVLLAAKQNFAIEHGWLLRFIRWLLVHDLGLSFKGNVNDNHYHLKSKPIKTGIFLSGNQA